MSQPLVQIKARDTLLQEWTSFSCTCVSEAASFASLVRDLALVLDRTEEFHRKGRQLT
jgi:hypothetical protein